MIGAMRSGAEMQARDGDAGQPTTADRPWRPRVIAALLLGAVASVVIELAPDFYQIFGPYPVIDSHLVLSALEAFLPFAFAAAVVYGADGWPTGQSRLWWGAGMLAFAAVLSLVAELVFAGISFDTITAFEGLNTWMPIRYITELAVTSAGVGLLATGLWRGRGSFGRDAKPTGGRMAVAVVGIVAALAVIADLWAAGLMVDGFPVDLVAFGLAGGLLTAATSIALGALAIVALRITPARAGQPELLIASGATLVLVGRAAQWALPYALQSGTQFNPLSGAIFTVVAVVTSFGLIAMSLGFVLSGLAAHPPRPVPEVVA